MAALIAYIIKSIVASGVLYAWYLLVLRNKKFHAYNRFYLLMTVGVSLVLPVINLRLYKLAPIIGSTTAEEPAMPSLTSGAVLTGCIGMISFVLLMIMCSKIIRLYKLKRRNGFTSLGAIHLIETSNPAAPFSFLNNLFWREGMSPTDDKGEKIFIHEMTHIRQKHTYDKLFVQTIACLCWINPFYWLIQKELNMVHEFMADAASIEEGDTESFALMLLQSHNQGRYLDPAHHFFYSPVIRRLNMIAAPKSASKRYIRKFLFLPLLALLLTLFSFNVSPANSGPRQRERQQKLLDEKRAQEGGQKVSMSCPARTFYIRYRYWTFI